MTCPNGKYKGQPKDVVLNDTGYCQWILENLPSTSKLYQYITTDELIPFTYCLICFPNIPEDRKYINEPLVDGEHPSCRRELLNFRQDLHEKLRKN